MNNKRDGIRPLNFMAIVFAILVGLSILYSFNNPIVAKSKNHLIGKK